MGVNNDKKEKYHAWGVGSKQNSLRKRFVKSNKQGLFQSTPGSKYKITKGIKLIYNYNLFEYLSQKYCLDFRHYRYYINLFLSY